MTTWKPFDAAEYLDSDETVAAYLSACLAEGDDALFMAALGDVARARGMTKLAADAGLSRESLYKALSPGSHPRLETVRRVVAALGLQMTIAPGGAAPEVVVG